MVRSSRNCGLELEAAGASLAVRRDMRVAQAVLLLGASVVQTDAAIDLQKIQDDYQNQVALSVVAVSCNTPRWCCTARHRRHQSRSTWPDPKNTQVFHRHSLTTSMRDAAQALDNLMSLAFKPIESRSPLWTTNLLICMRMARSGCTRRRVIQLHPRGRCFTTNRW